MKKLSKKLFALLLTLVMVLCVSPVSALAEEYDILRIYGSTRYGTSIAVADQLKIALNVEQFDTVVVASGTNFPDALSGSYLACRTEAPILIVGDDNSKDVMLKYIKKNLAPSGTIYVLGGNAAVSTSYVNQLKKVTDNVTVLSGSTRYATNIKVLAELPMEEEELLVADGSSANSFADALSASSTGNPLMLVNRGTADKKGVYKGTLTDGQLLYLMDAFDNNLIKKVTILGGTSAVPDTIYNQLVDIFGRSNVSRISGKTRYETSAQIAKRYFTEPVALTLAWGGNFPDALCGGPLAYAVYSPLVLTDTSSSAAKTYASTLTEYKVLALGGPGEGNDQLTDQVLKNVKSGNIAEYKNKN